MNSKDIYVDNTTKEDLGDVFRATGAYIFSKFDHSKKIKVARLLDITKQLFLYNKNTKRKVPLETYEARLMVIKREKRIDVAIELSDILAKDLSKKNLTLVN